MTDVHFRNADVCIEVIEKIKTMYIKGSPSEVALSDAIKALEEIQKYRAIGTPEECREAVEKQMEIRNKAIDDFMNIVEEKADGGYFDVGGYHDVTNDIVGILDQLAEQLKGGGVNE